MRVPYTNFKTRVGDDNAIGGCTFIGGEWKEVDTAEIFDNKKVVVFALPGAFTPTCSSLQLPGYEEKYDELKALGIDEVYCLSVNDAFVMFQWSKHLGTKNIFMLPDGNGEFTRKMGMLVEKENLGFGMRSWRYSMLVNDMVIEKMFVEPDFADNCPTDPFESSDADTMMAFLKGSTSAGVAKPHAFIG